MPGEGLVRVLRARQLRQGLQQGGGLEVQRSVDVPLHGPSRTRLRYRLQAARAGVGPADHPSSVGSSAGGGCIGIPADRRPRRGPALRRRARRHSSPDPARLRHGRLAVAAVRPRRATSRRPAPPCSSAARPRGTPPWLCRHRRRRTPPTRSRPGSAGASPRTAPPSSSGRPHPRTPAGSATSPSARDAAPEPGPNPLTISHPASPNSQANTGSAAAAPATESCA